MEYAVYSSSKYEKFQLKKFSIILKLFNRKFSILQLKNHCSLHWRVFVMIFQPLTASENQQSAYAKPKAQISCAVS